MKMNALAAILSLSTACLLVTSGCGPEEQETETAPSNGSVQQAATNLCGASYRLIDTYPMKNNKGAVNGHYNLYYNGTRNCGVAECYANCGVKMNRTVYIRVSSTSGSWDDFDFGQFTTYAGPVYSKPSAGKCLDLSAGFGVENSVASVNVVRVHCN
ncbi:hypothetical protein KH5H1_78030 [Corallococcus caeni]|uniref:hypothetical protein n=1 Tax=Corallococcus caeni TaxID=3082388 RepID=UPI00295640C7|nr:hypothetical protein KH5H1_78030 [Corallococcus sp. KH5-1]